MSDLGQAQTGSLRSTPKQVKIMSSDKSAVIFKNMGNSHNTPFIWSANATVTSGTAEVVLASGTKFYDMELASYASVTVTANSDPGARYWVDYNTTTNVVKLVVGSAVAADVDFKTQFILGPAIDVSELSTRGTGAPAQNYP